MIRFVAIGAIALLSAIGAAQAVAGLDVHEAAPLRAQTAAVQLDTPASSVAQVSKAADGHYWAEANVNGRAVRFLVDTGATTVALTLEDARRLGFDPAKLDYVYDVVTAEGRVKAAGVKLATISVAGARVDDVQALVIEKGLDTSLLGMSYLGRLRAFEATQTSLILKP